MESISALEKIKSYYILKSLIDYIKYKDFKYLFFKYSKSFQKNLELK